MVLLLILWQAVSEGIFGTYIDEARNRVQASDWPGAASALDAANSADAEKFAANNLPYLRGRAAEGQKDWGRAADEFQKIPPGAGLRQLAVWHAARAVMHLGNIPQAQALISELPSDFPADLKMELAREAPPELALLIYAPMNSRNARFRRAQILKDNSTMWALLRERNTDDVALECARTLADVASTPRELMDVANAFLAQRDFDAAGPLYLKASTDPAMAAEAGYQTARISFLSEDYLRAIEGYITVSENFPRTNWQKDAEYQIASSYWRLGRYADAEKAYTTYLARFGDRPDDGATRNLVDVLRAKGDLAKAVTLIDKKLKGRVPTASRQALLFAKAKVLYTQNKFTAARDIFRQLGTMRLANTPGGGTTDEVKYFEALSQSKIGNNTAAQNIWKTLARDPLSYYGQKSAQRLGASKEMKTPPQTCVDNTDPAMQSAMERFAAITRPIRTTADPAADAIADLVFMRLWDEAFTWLDRGRRLDARTAADLAYLAGRYDRAITYADRLPESDRSTWPFMYPAAYRQLVCNAASPYPVDPLWLHSIIWQESKYDSNAASAASARGLMQFIPETERAVGERIGMTGLTPDRLYDPELSIRLGAEYWSELMNEFHFPEMALAAYNGGPVNVRRWRDKLPNADVEFFVSDIGFPETKRYVQLIFGARAAYGRAQ